jgi:D-3-phosphoglycerate dehydrogenase
MAPWRVVMTDFTDGDHSLEADVFASSGLDIELVTADETREQGLAAAVAGAHALLVQFATIDDALIRSLDDCLVISRYGIGVDMIDLGAAARAGIPVTNVPDFCIDEVSTQTIGFLIDLNRQTWPLASHVAAGNWGSPITVAAPRRLAGQTLGVVGLGAIGREVARKAGALGLTVLAHDPYAEPDAESRVSMRSLDALLTESDYVTLHCPLNDSTRGLIGEAQLALMRPTAYLLNLSRGPVVDQDALRAALAAGVIAGAALDVLVTEPPPADDPLLRMDNVIITPHTSSWSAESLTQLRHDAARNVVEALLGHPLRSVVNKHLFTPESSVRRPDPSSTAQEPSS